MRRQAEELAEEASRDLARSSRSRRPKTSPNRRRAPSTRQAANVPSPSCSIGWTIPSTNTGGSCGGWPWRAPRRVGIQPPSVGSNGQAKNSKPSCRGGSPRRRAGVKVGSGRGGAPTRPSGPRAWRRRQRGARAPAGTPSATAPGAAVDAGAAVAGIDPRTGEAASAGGPKTAEAEAPGFPPATGELQSRRLPTAVLARARLRPPRPASPTQPPILGPTLARCNQAELGGRRSRGGIIDEERG